MQSHSETQSDGVRNWDWDLGEQFPNRYSTMAPERDIEAEDGKQLTLGDTTVTMWRISGHTPGALSYTFTGFDHGPHPFKVGADMVQRYFLVMQYCARAAQIKLEHICSR